MSAPLPENQANLTDNIDSQIKQLMQIIHQKDYQLDDLQKRLNQQEEQSPKVQLELHQKEQQLLEAQRMFKILQQEIEAKDSQLSELKANLLSMKSETYVRDVAINGLKNENQEMIAMIKRLVGSYEGNYQFKMKVEDFLNKEIGYLGDYHPSHKLTFDQLTELRGGM